MSSLKFKVPAGAKPNWQTLTVNLFDKAQRGRGFNFKEASECGGICSIHIDQLIRCYCLIDRAMTRDELIARCSNCPYAVAKPKTANVMDTNKYPYFIEEIADIEWDDPKYYVYLISDGEYIKIGIAKDVRTRLCELQVGNPNQLELICAIPLNSEKNARRLEEELHLEYDEFSIRGEWYNILRYINVQAFSKYFQKRRTEDERTLSEM